MAAHADFDELIPHMKRAGFLATGLAALITSSFGWTLGENLLAKISLAGLLALCTFIVGYALVAAYHAFKRNMYVVGGAAVFLFAVAVVCEFIAHTGFNAAHRDATMQQASHRTASYEDTRGTITALSADVKRLQERLRLSPTRTPEAAQAFIDNAMAHKFWKLTNSCKATKGPQTREFCSGYASAVADKSGATEALTLREDLKIAQDKLAKAKETAANTSLGHASATSQRLILASLISGEVRPDETTQYWAGVGMSGLLAIFAIVAGGLVNFLAYSLEREGSGAARAHAGVELARAPQTPEAPAPTGCGDRLQPVVKTVGGNLKGRDFYGREVMRPVSANA
jgi:hypothetical protein